MPRVESDIYSVYEVRSLYIRASSLNCSITSQLVECLLSITGRRKVFGKQNPPTPKWIIKVSAHLKRYHESMRTVSMHVAMMARRGKSAQPLLGS